MLDEIFVFGVVPLLGLVFMILWLTRPKMHIVPEEERLVLYQFGKFKRVAGPGRVWVKRRIENIERRLNVRDEPRYLEINGLYAYDIPLGYTLSIWYKVDPATAAGGDVHLLRKLVQFSNEECDENIRVRIHDLLVKHISEFLSMHSLPDTPTVLDKLVPFAPGQPACEQILNKLRQELPAVLRPFGAVWNPGQPIAIKKFHLASGIVKLLDRDRVMANFQQRMPNCDPDLMTQATIALEGVATPAMRKIVFNQSGGSVRPAAIEPLLGKDVDIHSDGNGIEEGVQIRSAALHRNLPNQNGRALAVN